MSEATPVAEVARKRIGAPPGHGRFPPVPPPPRWVRSEWEILDEQGGALGLTLWQSLRDVLLWSAVHSSKRRGLFRPVRASQQDLLARAIAAAPELADALRDLAQLSVVPESTDAARVAAACEAVWMWAEARGKHGTAIQFAEVAAKLEPKSSPRSYAAGRLCRMAADYERGVIWFRRAGRLARRAKPCSQVDRAIAHLGWGHLEHDQGNLGLAERHFLIGRTAALRNGPKSVAAAAHHDLFCVCVDARRFEEAEEYAEQAIGLYPDKDARVPYLACDIGVLWQYQSYFSSTIYLFAKALPWIAASRDRSHILALFARSAAAVQDRVRFERAATKALEVVPGGHDRADIILSHVAEGLASLGEWDRAERLAQQAAKIARARKNRIILETVDILLVRIANREFGDRDIVPEQGGSVERITSMVLQKLRGWPVPSPLDPSVVLFPGVLV
ncbi:MAG TPA: hypothetical protein VF263_19260 [Longimicrobiaceae bacterium]